LRPDSCSACEIPSKEQDKKNQYEVSAGL